MPTVVGFAVVGDATLPADSLELSLDPSLRRFCTRFAPSNTMLLATNADWWSVPLKLRKVSRRVADLLQIPDRFVDPLAVKNTDGRSLLLACTLPVRIDLAAKQRIRSFCQITSNFNHELDNASHFGRTVPSQEQRRPFYLIFWENVGPDT